MSKGPRLVPASQQVSTKWPFSFQDVALTLTFPHCSTDPGSAVSGDSDKRFNHRVFTWVGTGQASSLNIECGN